MLRIRVLVVSFFFCLMFGGALARLAELKFARADEFVAFRDNRLSNMEQKAPRRGRILDADGAILAEDQPTQDLWITPARMERVNRRRQVVSNLLPLTPEQIVRLASLHGGEREFELNLAAAALTEGNPMVAELSTRLRLERAEVARKILAAALAGRPESADDLVYPRPAIEDVDFALALEIRAARANPYDGGTWQAAEMRTGGKRFYPAGALLGHLTGTVGKLTAEEYEDLRGKWAGEDKVPGKGEILKQGRIFFSLDKPDAEGVSDEEMIIRLRETKRSGKMVRSQGYFANETVGRGGLEQHYNEFLRGRHTLQRLRLTRDAAGKRRFEPRGGLLHAENGQDIRLSIKVGVQRQVQEILEKHMKSVARNNPGWTPSAVAILMNPRNGRIHALVSLPTYDPNTYSRDFNKLLADPANPLLDRALSGIYPPGSVVKPVVGLAGLMEDRIMPGQRFNCDKVLMLAGARFTCLGRHGDVDLDSAIRHSCNIYFYHAGEALGGRRLYEWYRNMGLGHRTGIDVAGEASGILPRAAFTRRGWATGNTYHLAIGQGMAVTPLQIAVAYSALANSDRNVARIVRPHFMIPPASTPTSEAGERLAREAMALDQPMAEIMVDREAIGMIRQAMWEVVQGTDSSGTLDGTGQRAAFLSPDGRGFLLELAGKTGTAEWSQVRGGVVQKQISHVWFAGYAPFDRPEVVVVVMLPEAGGGGGGTCAPIAKDILRMWFNIPERPDVAVEEEGALG